METDLCLKRLRSAAFQRISSHFVCVGLMGVLAPSLHRESDICICWV